jgi:hypothetical protein
MRGSDPVQPSLKGVFALRVSPNYFGVDGGICMQKWGFGLGAGIHG